MRKHAVSLLLICMMVLGLTASAFAEEYTYTVRFFAGKQGSFGGREIVTYSNLKEGDQVSFNAKSVSVNDEEKYYVKGIRTSGMDNNTVSTSSFTVTKDVDFVVAYGVWGQAVAYTIHYVDEAGNQLAPSETFYGNVGDKPVVGYLYIEGYQPQYYNITGTLQENPDDNKWTFVYISEPEPSPSPSPSPSPNTSPTPEEGVAGESETAAQEEIFQPGARPSAGTDDSGSEPASVSGGSNASEQTTQDILDLDVPQAEPETPVDGIQNEEQRLGSFGNGIRYAVLIGGLALLGLLVLVIFLLRRKSSKQNKS